MRALSKARAKRSRKFRIGCETMKRGFSRQPAQEQSGPFQFHTTMLRCPSCRELLLSQERVSFGTTSKILHVLGMSCYCMACNGKYRVTARAWMHYLPWISGAAMLCAGGLGGYTVLLMPSGTLSTGLVLGIFGVECVLFSRLLLISTWLWWRLAKIKKIFTYQEGGMF